ELPVLSSFTSDAITVTGHVARSGLLRESNAFTRGDKAPKAERSQTIDVETEKITLNDESQTQIPMRFGVRVNIHSKAMEQAAESEALELTAEEPSNGIPVYFYGDPVQFAAKLREPRNYGNPGAMDY